MTLSVAFSDLTRQQARGPQGIKRESNYTADVVLGPGVKFQSLWTRCVSVLTPEDVISGAAINGHPGAYVLGLEDTRITFFSQQVRALELAYALQREQFIRENARIAVIGGGAAGVTFAAALALQGGANVHLFEQADDLLPLQGAASRRRIDPHIYEWPKPYASHELAQLPILDWRSGSAMEVRAAVLREFDQLKAALEQKPTIRLRHTVTSIVPRGSGFQVHFTHDAPADGRQTAEHEFDIVVLAIGFGIERPSPIPNTQTESYWRDAGVPEASIDGNPAPTFFVSGNGDGGLIDLIASAERSFRHAEIVRGIAQRASVQALREPLLAIDIRALDAEAAGDGFDFIAAYDAEIGAEVVRLGLLDDLQGRLRPGVQLYFQTQQPELLSIRTARLNRLVVYLLKKVCDRNNPSSFNHIVCDEVASVDSLDTDRPRSRRLRYDTTEVVVDWVIARRGPDRNNILQPFSNLLADYETDHKAWTRRFPEDSISPKLSEQARSHFTQHAARAKLPPPSYRRDEVAQALPRSGMLQLIDGQARWSGDVLLTNVSTLWSGAGSHFDLTVVDPPTALGAVLSQAIARLVIHAADLNLLVDVARWKRFVTDCSSDSQSASGLPVPTLMALGANASILNPVALPPEHLAAQINQALDHWLLDAIDAHLMRYIAHGEDPQRAVTFVAAACLRQQMLPIWRNWLFQFRGNPALLSRFLGLASCAKDEPAAAGEASTLAGPRLLPSLIRACAVALMVATAWQTTAPHGARPGNLVQVSNGSQRTGHACAAGFIDGEDMSVEAQTHAWTTEFVLLPMQSIAPILAASANTSLGTSGTMLLDKAGQAGKMVLAVDPQFRSAAKESAAALGTLLGAIEQKHFAQLRAAIEEKVEANA